MSDTRRRMMQQLAAGAAVMAASPALAQTARADSIRKDSTPADFVTLQKELSNWGRWGADDQTGAVNLITPAKRRAAMRLAREGASYSMARNAETKEAVDNAMPIMRKTIRTGASVSHTGIASTSDNFFIAYHGLAHTHMDTLSHFAVDGKLYNGFSVDTVTEEGAAKNSIISYKNGIITRGVLYDMARHKGVEWLEPGDAIYPEDLDAWEKKAGVKVQSGDVMIVRTGRWARRDAKGPWVTGKEGLAGLHMSCARWMHARDVAILGGDDAQDVQPSRVEGVSQPIHALCIVAMGMPIFDNLELELVGGEAAKRKRWEFLVTASPAAVPGATGSVLNPIASF
jgi:kynurenine formamidase